MDNNKFTPIQIECYERNMNCRGCMYSKYKSQEKCQLKKSIMLHIKKYGLPKNLETKGVLHD